MNTRAASRLVGASNDTSTHQNGMHLLGPSQGGEGEHDEESRDEEELRMLRDVVSEEMDGEMGVRAATESRMEDQSRMKSEESGIYWPPTILRVAFLSPTPHQLASERVAAGRSEEIDDTKTLEQRSTSLDRY